MVWALLFGLLATLLGGGDNKFDMTESSEFRRSERIMKSVVGDSERQDAILEISSEMRDLEKDSMKDLNRSIKDLQKKNDWGWDADMEAWQSGYNTVLADSRNKRDELTVLLGEWKSHFTEEEWEEYLLQWLAG